MKMSTFAKMLFVLNKKHSQFCELIHCNSCVNVDFFLTQSNPNGKDNVFWILADILHEVLRHD